jgi:uncharacterized UPF0160 family protein
MLKKIGTHSGSFHCDEVMACYLLKNTKEFANSTITRTRDRSILATLDIVVDVGDEFDPSRNRFDHHQKSFNDFFGGKYNHIRLSSAGLIWKYFGKEIIQNLSGISDEAISTLVYNKMYSELFQALDAVDNGIAQYSTNEVERYKESTTLPSRVGRLNPSWKDPNPDYDSCFYKALKLVENEFTEIFNYIVNDWLTARSIVEKSLMACIDVHESQKIMVLSQFCPWKDHLYSLEDEYSTEKVIYVIYSDSNKKWKVQAAGIPGQAFAMRLPLPEAWRGKRDEELKLISGIDDIEFVHATGFIGGANSYEGVLKMAKQSLGFN